MTLTKFITIGPTGRTKFIFKRTGKTNYMRSQNPLNYGKYLVSFGLKKLSQRISSSFFIGLTNFF